MKDLILTMKEEITNGISGSIESDIKINKIAGVYKNIKEKYEKNVSETELIFEIFNILSFIHLGFLANMIIKNDIYILHLIYGCFTILIYGIFLWLINSINKATDEIDDLIKKHLFLGNFFKDCVLNQQSPINDVFTEEITEIHYLLQKNTKNINDINQKLRWHILNEEVKEDWIKYTICGFIEIDGASIITKIIAIGITIFLGANIVSLFV